MTRGKHKFRPWWRRRWWPLACALAAMGTLFLGCATMIWPWDWMSKDDRGLVWLAHGTIMFIVTDDQYVEDSRRTREESNGRAHNGIPGIVNEPRHAFALPELVWNAELRGSYASGTPGPVYGHASGAALPLGWPTTLFAGLAFFGFWRLWRYRRLPGHCPICGYDLRGLATGKAGAVTCPECGKAGTVSAQE